MSPLPIITGSFNRSEDIIRLLADIFETQLIRPDRTTDAAHGPFVLVDVNLKHSTYLRSLSDWLNRGPKHCIAILSQIKARGLKIVRAHATGATSLIHRPIDRKMLFTKLWAHGLPPIGRSARSQT